MAKRKKSDGGGGADWMGTYGDMVTLLLCFFVLLYSMSTTSQDKWEILVKSMNPNAKEVSQIVINEEPNDYENLVEGSIPPEEMDEFDMLYYQLSQYVQQNSLETQIELSKGDGFTFITFRDNVFFDGDSYVLKEEGKRILDDFAIVINEAKDSIQEMQILGHTSQASPTEANEPVSDRFLASNRATQVLLYIQQKNILDPAKLVSSGYGQFRPISSFDTRESRSKNRRVEMLITKTDSVVKSLDQYYEEAYMKDVTIQEN